MSDKMYKSYVNALSKCREHIKLTGNPTRILVVGERAHARHSILEESNKHADDAEWNVFSRLVAGAYTIGSARRNLQSAGLEWDKSINILWPSPNCGEWSSDDDINARAMVKLMRPTLEKMFSVIILTGKRACRAFNVPFVPSSEFNNDVSELSSYIVIPHPSGLNRQWNKLEKDTRRIAEYIKSISSQLKDLEISA